MLTLPLGALILIASFLLSAGTTDLRLFLNSHAFYLVVCGTVGVLVLSTPRSVLAMLYRNLKAFFKKEAHFSDFQSALQEMAKGQAVQSGHPLVDYASELREQGTDPELFIVLVSQRRKEMDDQNIESVQCLKNLAKYPPALGMTGTVMGIIGLFGNLGKDASSIGAELSLAMIATLFGLVVANGLISPIADRLQLYVIKQKNLSTALFEVLLLINQGEAEVMIEQEVNRRAA